MTEKTHKFTKFSIFVSFTGFWDLSCPRRLKEGRPEERWLNDLVLTHGLFDTFFSVFPPNYLENRDLGVSWWQNYEDQKNRHSFQVTSRVIEWRHESSGDTSNIIFIYLIERNFEYDMFRTTTRFLWCMIILVDKFYNICNVNNTCTGRLIPV